MLTPGHSSRKTRIISTVAVALLSLAWFVLPNLPAAIAASSPTISGVSPRTGTTSGGTRVTVTGHGFKHVRAVRFGAARGTSVRVLSSTRLKVTAPKHAAGKVHVKVVTAAGHTSAARKDRFTYVAPQGKAPSGSYSGLDAAGRGVTFFVSASGTVLQDISVPVTDLACVPDGGGDFDKIQIATIAIKADGSFTSTTNQTGVFAGHPATFTYVFNGHLDGLTTAGAQHFAGQLRESIHYTDIPARDCTTNTQAWNATRDTQPAQPTTAPPSGSYSGLDTQGRGVTFFVSATGTVLQDVSVPVTDLRCIPDGGGAFDRFQIASIPLNSDGSFTSTTTQDGAFGGHPATFTYLFNGHVHGLSPSGFPRLAGQLRESIDYTDIPARDCTTNAAAWNAVRDTQPAQPTTTPPPGTYSGLDTQGRGVTFSVSGTNLQDVSVPTTDLACLPDGGGAFDKIQIASIALNADGSFTSTTNQSGVFAGHPATFTYLFNGHVHGLSPSGAPRLAGQLRESISYTDTPARTCTTNLQAWNAVKS